MVRIVAALFAFLFILSYAWDYADIESVLQKQAVSYYVSQSKEVTVSVSLGQYSKIPIAQVHGLATQDCFYNGYNTTKALLKSGKVITFEFWLNVKEWLPVASEFLRPDRILVSENIGMGWVPADNVSNFVIRDKQKLLGMNLKYFKDCGAPFMDTDLSDPIVLRAHERCRITLRNGPITIVSEGISLINGSVGCKIRVRSVKTQKVLEGVVVDSHNVEVRLDK